MEGYKEKSALQVNIQGYNHRAFNTLIKRVCPWQWVLGWAAVLNLMLWQPAWGWVGEYTCVHTPGRGQDSVLS